jgi:hypothetical protein
MVHAKCLTSSLCQFREDDFLKFLLYTCTYIKEKVRLILTLEANIEQLWYSK